MSVMWATFKENGGLGADMASLSLKSTNVRKLFSKRGLAYTVVINTTATTWAYVVLKRYTCCYEPRLFFSNKAAYIL